MKSDWRNEHEKVLKNYINIIIKYNEDHDEIRWILILLQKKSVLNMRRMRIIEFVAKKIYFHERWNIWCCSNQVFHVNSSDHKKLVNVIQSADLTLISFSLNRISLIILRRIEAVSGNCSILTSSSYIHFPLLMMRSMWGLSKIMIERANSRWRKRRVKR